MHHQQQPYGGRHRDEDLVCHLRVCAHPLGVDDVGVGGDVLDRAELVDGRPGRLSASQGRMLPTMTTSASAVVRTGAGSKWRSSDDQAGGQEDRAHHQGRDHQGAALARARRSQTRPATVAPAPAYATGRPNRGPSRSEREPGDGGVERPRPGHSHRSPPPRAGHAETTIAPVARTRATAAATTPAMPRRWRKQSDCTERHQQRGGRQRRTTRRRPAARARRRVRRRRPSPPRRRRTHAATGHPRRRPP